MRARYGSAPLGIANSVALKGNVLDWIEVSWADKAADRRLDPFKFALSWATGRHPERVPVNYLHGIPRFYEGADRAEIIWEDAEVDLFCQKAPEAHADAVRLARETGLRIGDLVELERGEIADAQAGLAREPHCVGVSFRSSLAEQVDLGVLPDDLGAVSALVEARDAMQVVDRHSLRVPPGRPAERELERVEALVGRLADPAHLDPVEHVTPVSYTHLTLPTNSRV